MIPCCGRVGVDVGEYVKMTSSINSVDFIDLVLYDKLNYHVYQELKVKRYKIDIISSPIN